MKLIIFLLLISCAYTNAQNSIASDFIIDNIWKPLVNDIKNNTINFLYNQITSTIINTLFGGIGKRDASNLKFFEEYQQVFDTFQFKISAYLKQLLEAIKVFNNVELKNYLEIIRQELKTEAENLVENIKNLLEKYFSWKPKNDASFILNTVSKQVNVFLSDALAKINTIDQAV